MSRRVVIRWPGGEVTGRWNRLRSPTGASVLLAHGAGTNQDHPGVVGLGHGLVRRGHQVLTFNYPYTEAGRRRPDRQATLLACHLAALRWLRSRDETIVMAGRSMGGRMASYLAAEGETCAGLVLYGYPLHPPGRPEKLRADHLSGIRVPMLFITGSRDSLATPELFDRWIRPLQTATTEVVQDADHSFRIPKRTGWTTESLLDWMTERTSNWIGQIE